MKPAASIVIAIWLTATAGSGAITLISVAQEVEFGRQASVEVSRVTPALRDADVEAYVRGLGRHLVAYADGPKYPYSFHMADYREINAFALPGGPVWVHRGVLQSAANESQVVSVLAHEIAHISQRHAADQLTKSIVANLGLGLLSAVLGNDMSAAAARMAAGAMANGVFLKFSRDDEMDADRVGLQMMTRAGWDARGMIELVDMLRREGQRDPGRVDVFLSTHPSPQDRASSLRIDVARLHGGKRDSKEFRAMKTRLSRMAPAQVMKKPL